MRLRTYFIEDVEKLERMIVCHQKTCRSKNKNIFFNRKSTSKIKVQIEDRNRKSKVNTTVEVEIELENRKSKSKIDNHWKNRKSKIENRKSKIENRKSKIEWNSEVSQSVNFFSQRENFYYEFVAKLWPTFCLQECRIPFNKENSKYASPFFCENGAGGGGTHANAKSITKICSVFYTIC